jgi:hypothetical protein
VHPHNWLHLLFCFVFTERKREKTRKKEQEGGREGEVSLG